jgi:hypothetical protein
VNVTAAGVRCHPFRAEENTSAVMVGVDASMADEWLDSSELNLAAIPGNQMGKENDYSRHDHNVNGGDRREMSAMLPREHRYSGQPTGHEQDWPQPRRLQTVCVADLHQSDPER